MRFDIESTICSIATGFEGAYRGAIRISGPDSVAIARSCCCVSNDSLLSSTVSDSPWNTKKAIRFPASILLQELGQLELDIFVWPDSRSYTGQPSVELHCLGNTIVLQAIQNQLLAKGAVLAQPGEFTLRAFLAGRLDLTQCEAVLGVIHAANERSLNVALSQLAGGLSTPLSDLRTSLVHLLADIEAGLDFVDEDIAFISRDQILLRLEAALASVNNLLAQMDARAGQTVPLQVVLVGEPNAGKSSLVNAMAAKQVSIVSEQPGTTRDYVRTRLDLDGVFVDILDTAGLEVADIASPRGLAQEFTQKQLEQADLILHCQATDLAMHESNPTTIHAATDTEIWQVNTKCDLLDTHPPVDADSIVPKQNYSRSFLTSAFASRSTEHLMEAIREWAHDREMSDAQVVPLTAARCVASLNAARQSLEFAREATLRSTGDEVIAGEIRLALEEIGMVAGTVYTDDILDALFSRFCIGK